MLSLVFDRWRVLRGNGTGWLFPEPLQEITTGGQYLLFLLLVLTSEFLQQEFSPLLEEIYGCHWYVRIDRHHSERPALCMHPLSVIRR